MGMGVYIVLCAVVFEIAFVIFCSITRSNQHTVRSIARILGFVIVVLCIISPIFDWGLRYYAITALLFVLALLGTLSLLRKKEDRKPYKTSRTVFKAIGMTALIFLCTLPAILFPQHESMKPTGEYQVARYTYSYMDTDRIEIYTDTGELRKLNVELWYPEDARGTFPLILFSHGAFGVRTSNVSLYNELASHGYVVCSIDHTYQCLYTRGSDGKMILMDRGYIREVSVENARVDKQQSFGFYQKWMKIRTDDMSFALTQILKQVKDQEPDTVYSLIDPTKIGVMGHSLGGSAALGLGRMRSDVSCVIALESPFMGDITGVTDSEFVFTEEEYPLPVLNVYSDQGWGLLSNAPQYAENYALLFSSSMTEHTVHISGAGHLSLTDLALESPLLTRMLNQKRSTTDSVYCLRVVNKVCLDFFDSYLKGKHVFSSGGTY